MWTCNKEVKQTSSAISKAKQQYNESKQFGTWTMVYDEGFEITLRDVKYFAFSKY
jgi:hypothetical protein